MDPQLVRTLIAKLQATKTFEEACEPYFDALQAVLGPVWPTSTVARVFVHVRNESSGYHALHARHFVDDPSSLSPSTAIWRAIEQTREGVGIDLGLGRGETLVGRGPMSIAPLHATHDPSASVRALLANDVTHVVGVPLLSHAGDLAGMVCVELAWLDGIGASFPEGEWRTSLGALTDIASAMLLARPLGTRSNSSRTGDALLPVAGAKTRPMLRVLEVFSQQEETLLLAGPTGAGKSRVAHWCHARSPRASGPFETANLLAVPETMQLAELFGWRRGAFTGAHSDHEGLVAAAERGTLFLDEIDKLSLAAQAALLRLLETRRFSPLGAMRERTANVRFVVATNADLRALVRAGTFREDLYYRINVLPVRVPALAERTDEIGTWATEFLARRHGEAAAAASFTNDALSALEHARWPSGDAWPGNLRQLDNVVRRAYTLALARRLSASPGVVVERDDVVEALHPETSDRATQSVGFDELLRQVADQLVDLAVDERRRGRTVALADIDVLRGAVLRAAVDRVGSVKDAYQLFGAEQLVQSRNHQAAYRRDVGALEALSDAVRAAAKGSDGR